MKALSRIFTICMSFLLSGCMTFVERNPPFDCEKSGICQHASQTSGKRNSRFSYDELVHWGWSRIYKSSDPRFNNVSIEISQHCFNIAWALNNDGYDAYWGWGIIRRIQAERTYFRYKKIGYLRDAIHYMELATEKTSFDRIHLTSIRLDQIRCWILLGQEFLAKEQLEEVAHCVKTAKSMLNYLSMDVDCEIQYAKEINKQLDTLQERAKQHQEAVTFQEDEI